MPYTLLLTSDAIFDIDQGFDYYNRVLPGLGFEFTDTVDRYFQKITSLPDSSPIRYSDIRVKAIDTFPFTIHFRVSGTMVIIVRLFNTNQRPFW